MNKKILIKIKKSNCRNIAAILIVTGALFGVVDAYASKVKISDNTTIQQIMQQKKVSLQVENETLKKILYRLQEQSSISFVIKDEKSVGEQRFSLNVTNVTVEDALKQLLKNSSLTYQIIGSTVTILPKTAELKNPDNQQRKIAVNGKILDGDKKPIPGATILVAGSTNGAITDDNGNFALSLNQGDVLEITYIGMKPIVYNKPYVQGEDLIIRMEKDAMSIEDIVVNGYVSRKRESLTGSAVVVTSSELAKVSSQNIISALQVFDPSFRVSDNVDMGSNPNALPDFRIRGNSGLGAINQGNLKGSPNLPTFILDGYEVDVEKIYDLDMNRVESVTILKDASATAIYGSRAANGVVVVMTKAPKEGKLSVNYSFTANIQAPDLSDYRLLNAARKLEAEVKAGRYDSTDSSPDAEQAYRLDYAARYRNVMEGVDTYWLSQPLRTAFGHKHSLNVEGGDKAVRYGINVGYNSTPGVMKSSFRDRMDLGFVLSYNLKDRLLFRNNITISKMKSQESKYGSFKEYAKMNSYYKPYDENGNLIEEYKGEVVTSYRIMNPLYQATLNNKDESRYTEWANNFDFEWKILKPLRLKAKLAYSEKNSDSYKYKSPRSIEYRAYDYQEGEGVMKRGAASKTNQNETKLDANVLLTYNQEFGKHSVNGVVGGNLIESTYANEGYSVIGFANEILDLPSFANAFDGTSPSGDEGTTRMASIFANFNYSFANKYLLDATFRMDGSSIYGSEKRSAPFWSIGLGWNIHNEKFFKNVKVVNHLKVTANIGTTGKATFQPYEAQTSFQYNREQWYGTLVGATLMAMGNNRLEWEKTTLTDVRLEVGLFNNLLFISGNYYEKDTKDLVSDVTLPYSSGFRSYKENIGALNNRGYEINARVYVVRKKDLNINIYGALTHNKNEIKEISNSLRSYNESVDKEMDESGKGKAPRIKFMEGQSTTAIYAVRSLGINPSNGQELFVNRDGSLTYLWDASQQVVCGDSEPLVSGTLGANVDYKGFNLNLNFLYEAGGKSYNQTLVDRVENANIVWNVDERVLEDRWIKPGDKTFFKDIKDRSVTNVTSRFVQKNNLLRLQSLSLSYRFDIEQLGKSGIQNLKIGFLMNDVFRVSTIKQERGLEYPFARSFNFNLQIQF